MRSESLPTTPEPTKPWPVPTVAFLNKFEGLVREEIARARAKHPPYHSAHEAFGVLLEEVEEFKGQVWLKEEKRDREAMLHELVQIASTAQMSAYAVVGLVDAGAKESPAPSEEDDEKTGRHYSEADEAEHFAYELIDRVSGVLGLGRGGRPGLETGGEPFRLWNRWRDKAWGSRGTYRHEPARRAVARDARHVSDWYDGYSVGLRRAPALEVAQAELMARTGSAIASFAEHWKPGLCMRPKVDEVERAIAALEKARRASVLSPEAPCSGSARTSD